ncbi:2-amino-3-carboxymuconate-6-semialdehyde decarboxylase protein [Rutstroemia sp. NJR-2017a WRK4]|nr:2-amino-3-carboxymuconate-6-semialdehyde decarboxylase protein [Rutstroemia sp. NJR-2017a WRK4]
MGDLAGTGSTAGTTLNDSTISHHHTQTLAMKSQWGVLGRHKNPAGIIYLDLTFDQPKDSQLHSATVIITLDDEDQELNDIRGKFAPRGSTVPQCPVHITDSYGPKGFTGPEKIVQMTKSQHLTPSAQFAGYEISGVSVDKESSFTYSSRWKFSGQLLPGKRNHWTFKTLKWELSENDLEAQTTHSNEVHTAFTFEHGGQPFFMRVEIKGKLRKLHGRVKEKLRKFPSNSKKDDGSIVTLINFGERALFKTPLDQRARELELEMEIANLHAIPMEVSDPKPVTFQRIQHNSGQSNMPNSTAVSGSWSQQQSAVSGAPPQQQSPASTQPQPLQRAGSPTTAQNATAPTLVNLAQAFVHLQALERQVPHHNDSTNVFSATLARSETERTIADSGGEDPGQNDFSEEQMLLRLLRMPAFLTFLRVISVFLGFLGRTSSSEEASERQHLRISDKTENESEAFHRRKLFPAQRANRVFDEVSPGSPPKGLNRQREKVTTRRRMDEKE